ncbi:tail fiber protein [Pectobacterium brasiliense]|uniref:tail fiber protein n=1 Tax=Pectobacterium brasiliense TaxID=180957 RepID=UPI0019694FE7|nr:tail fiber protein [Pectobacterium brasiliense]MBN3230737.1 tail fiber protein [Pectobacterium brasiliense]
MANLSEQESWINGIYQLETSDPVVAGPGGISNRQAEQLASRTAYLKKMQEATGESLQTHLAASDPHSQYAPKNSPALTGTPTAPTTAQTANNTQIATTAFVKSAIAALINGSPAALDTLQELANALGNDPHFSTTILNAIADVKTDAANKLNAHASIVDAHPQYAPKASPAFTGTPTAPTAASGSNDTQLATTAFVKAAVAALVNGSPAALDTLQELANALGNDPNFSTTVLNALAGKLAKDQNGADIPDREVFNRNIGSGRAYSSAIDFGGASGEWTTADFINWLRERGAFSHAYWTCRGSWSYANNRTITDTECGNLNLAGAVVEVFGHNGNVTIRVTTPSTAPRASDHANAQFTYVFNGTDYFPGWRRDYNSRNRPTAVDVGALPIAGGVLQGGIRIGAGNIDLPASRAVVGVMPDESYRQMLSLSPDNTVVFGNPNSSAVIHTTDRVYIAAAGGAWRSVYHEGNLTPSAIGAMPVSELAGIPLPFPGAVAPAGWLKCNGQQFDTAQFPVLASRYPSGFLPDLRGEFVRGWDDGRGADAGRALISSQNDAIRSHKHSITMSHEAGGTKDSAGFPATDGSAPFIVHSEANPDGSVSETNGAGNPLHSFGGSETRPRNIAFNYIVRAA